jgi:hypothetical protein
MVRREGHPAGGLRRRTAICRKDNHHTVADAGCIRRMTIESSGSMSWKYLQMSPEIDMVSSVFRRGGMMRQMRRQGDQRGDWSGRTSILQRLDDVGDWQLEQEELEVIWQKDYRTKGVKPYSSDRHLIPWQVCSTEVIAKRLESKCFLEHIAVPSARRVNELVMISLC